MFTKKKKLFSTGAVVALLQLITSTTFAFAADDVFEAVKGIGNDLYGDLFGIVTTIACVCLIICGISYLSSHDAKNVQAAKDWAKRILFAYIAICLIGLVISTISKYAKKYSSNKIPAVTMSQKGEMPSFSNDLFTVVDL